MEIDWFAPWYVRVHPVSHFICRSEMQISVTMDYATDSWLASFFTGGLNHQTAHHLFPGISQYYYPEITPIVVQTCKEFGVPYHYKGTFLEVRV